MSKVRAHISVSLDGYVAGPNPTQEDPLGEGGERLHDWLVVLKSWREQSGLEGGEESVSKGVVAEEKANVDDERHENRPARPQHLADGQIEDPEARGKKARSRRERPGAGGLRHGVRAFA